VRQKPTAKLFHLEQNAYQYLPDIQFLQGPTLAEHKGRCAFLKRGTAPRRIRGAATLSYLQQFPIDVLKIDQSFAHGITADLDDSPIVSAIP
jgi:hypothetical protein